MVRDRVRIMVKDITNKLTYKWYNKEICIQYSSALETQNNISSEHTFVTKLRREHELCMAYEKPEAKAKALEVIPLSRLQKSAQEQFDKLKNS